MTRKTQQKGERNMSKSNTIAVRIYNPKTHDYFKRVYRNKCHGATIAVSFWPYLRTRTLVELKGVFSRSELCALIDIHNGTHVQPTYAYSSIIEHQLSDGCDSSGLAEKWGIKKEDTVTKINSLTAAQTIIFLDWIRLFWEKSDVEIEEYCEELA